MKWLLLAALLAVIPFCYPATAAAQGRSDGCSCAEHRCGGPPDCAQCGCHDKQACRPRHGCGCDSCRPAPCDECAPPPGDLGGWSPIDPQCCPEQQYCLLCCSHQEFRLLCKCRCEKRHPCVEQACGCDVCAQKKKCEPRAHLMQRDEDAL